MAGHSLILVRREGDGAEITVPLRTRRAQGGPVAPPCAAHSSSKALAGGPTASPPQRLHIALPPFWWGRLHQQCTTQPASGACEDTRSPGAAQCRPGSGAPSLPLAQSSMLPVTTLGPGAHPFILSHARPKSARKGAAPRKMLYNTIENNNDK